MKVTNRDYCLYECVWDCFILLSSLLLVSFFFFVFCVLKPFSYLILFFVLLILQFFFFFFLGVFHHDVWWSFQRALNERCLGWSFKDEFLRKIRKSSSIELKVNLMMSMMSTTALPWEEDFIEIRSLLHVSFSLLLSTLHVYFNPIPLRFRFPFAFGRKQKREFIER